MVSLGTVRLLNPSSNPFNEDLVLSRGGMAIMTVIKDIFSSGTFGAVPLTLKNYLILKIKMT